MRHNSRRLRIALLGAIALGAVACGTDAPQEEEVVITPEGVLNSAADRMEGVGSFAFLMEHENGFTPIVGGIAMERAEGWISGGNRMKADIRARVGTLAIDMGIVALPDSSWMTNPFTRAWEPGTFDVSALFDPATGLPALLRGLIDPQLVGTEDVNGTSAHRIDATVDSGSLAALIPGAAPGTALVVRVWIGEEDPVLHRAEIVGSLAEGDSAEIVRRITLSRFGEDLPVESPLAAGAAQP